MVLYAEELCWVEQGKTFRYPSPHYSHLSCSHNVRVELSQVHALIGMSEEIRD